MPARNRPNRREAAAKATRREILETARRLFVGDGYAATSIQRIATEAGVSVQTIYSSVGSKAALVLALNDLIDEESGMGEVVAQLGQEQDSGRKIGLAVRLTRQLNERCGDLVALIMAAAPSEPDLAAAYQDGLDRHRQGTRGVARQLHAAKALTAGVSEEQAASTIAMMTSPASWTQLTGADGWSFDDAEEWITDSLTRLLLTVH